MTTENRKDPAPEQAASLFPGKPGFAPEKKTGVGGVLLRSEPIEYNQSLIHISEPTRQYS